MRSRAGKARWGALRLRAPIGRGAARCGQRGFLAARLPWVRSQVLAGRRRWAGRGARGRERPAGEAGSLGRLPRGRQGRGQGAQRPQWLLGQASPGLWSWTLGGSRGQGSCLAGTTSESWSGAASGGLYEDPGRGRTPVAIDYPPQAEVLFLFKCFFFFNLLGMSGTLVVQGGICRNRSLNS